MNWYIGQEIVCIKTHSQGAVIEGKFYTINGLKTPTCSCKHILVDVGLVIFSRHYSCSCGHRTKNTDDVWWLWENLFAPLSEISEVHEALKEEPFKVCL